MATDDPVTYELRDGVASLGLNRPHKRNAIGEGLLAALETGVRRAQNEARALVTFGHGPCFSAGLDLAEHRAREPGEVFLTAALSQTGQEAAARLAEFAAKQAPKVKLPAQSWRTTIDEEKE